MKGLTNPYLRALFGSLIQYGSRAQMIAVAYDSKGFCVFINRAKPKRQPLRLPLWFGADEGT